MVIKLGNKTVEFRKGFKPKSLSEFKKVFGSITGAENSELESVYKKLRGKSKRTSGKAKENKS